MKSRFVMLSLLTLSLTVASSTFAQDRAQLEGEIDSLHAQLRGKALQFLDVSEADKIAFAGFLSQPDTGLVRLLPRGRFDQKLSITGGGAYYSFTRLTHEYGYGSDISLESDLLRVGFAGADFGFLTNLGDVAIEAVSEEHPVLVFLTNFNAPAKETKAREQQRLAGEGFQRKEAFYRNRLEAAVDNTYVLRSVNYGRSDVLVIFRVVRKDTDNSLILAWKLLKKFPVPELTRLAPQP